MSRHALAVWSERLKRAAGAPGGVGDDGIFADEMGHRRAVDAPFMAWRARTPGRGVDVGVGRSVDVLLWRAALDRSVDVDQLTLSAGHGAPAPITPQASSDAIEVWTEAELCALHALWRIGRVRERDDLIDRCLLSAAWHVEHIQPDNATNHPWAIHVFIVAAYRTGAAEHELHAQSLLHSCQVNLGRADVFSSHILLDAAECLEEEVGR